MRVVILSTGTNNVPPITDPLTALGNDVTAIIYDSMTHAEHESLPVVVEQYNPDWVLYVGALPEHHGKPVPKTTILAQIGAKHKLVHLCFDGAEIYWQRQLQEYYDEGRFALQVNIDGTRTGPIGDRGLTALCPVDVPRYGNPPWSDRSFWCGFSGGIHAGRPAIIYPMCERNALVYRPRDDSGSYVAYSNFLSMCRIGLNVAVTGGVIGGNHVKFRCLEASAAGCLVLETKGSPLGDWFGAGVDYLEYDGVDDAVRQVQWVQAHAGEAQAMAAGMRAKVMERHSPAVFWSQVMERLGFGRALRPAPEPPYRNWQPDYVPPPFGGVGTIAVSVPVLPTIAPEPPIVEYSPQPRLLNTYRRINIVSLNGQIYTIPQALGPIDISVVDLTRQPLIRRYPDVASAQRALVQQ